MTANRPVTTGTVVAEIEVAAPPARVFAALTEAPQLAAWWGEERSVELVGCEMDARPGGRWRLRWKPVPGVAQGTSGEQLLRNGHTEYEVHGEILEFDPPRRLVWSWIANWHERPEVPTEVQWELTPTATGTLVRVTHTGLAQEPRTASDYAGGWTGVIALLQTHFAAPPGNAGVAG